MSRILVTGAASWEGVRFVRRLRERGDEVIAVDDHDGVPFPLHVTSLDTLEFAHFVVEADPNAIVHLATIDRSAEIGVERARESVILGSQALFGAVERLRNLEHLVVRSEGNVYGGGNRRSLICREDDRISGQAARHSRALREVERYATEAADRLGVTRTVLRVAESVGGPAESPLAQLLRLPMVPVLWGFDPLLQLLHPDDLRDAFLHALDHPLDGTFNVAPRGPLYLSQLLRLAHIRAQRLPKPQLDLALRLLRRGGLAVPSQTLNLLRHGRVLHTAALSAAGFTPLATTRQIASAMAEVR